MRDLTTFRTPGGFGEFYVYATQLFAQDGREIRFDSDADFELQRLSIFFDPDGAPQTEETRRIPQLNFNILDKGTGRTVFAGFTDSGAMFGDGRVPFVLPTTHFFQRAAEAEFTFDPVNPGVNFDGGAVYALLIGRKHFNY